MKKSWNGKAVRGILSAMCAICLWVGCKDICFADTTGKVTAASAKIRKSADVGSEVIGSSEAGKTITITGKTSDASGATWYEVYVDANTKGYIRSDLVSVDESSGTIATITPASTNTDAATQTAVPAVSAEGAEVPAETAMDAQYASVKVAAAKVRSGASTTKGVVDSLPQNTQVVVSGQTNGSDGQVWYYITFTGTGNVEKTGYVRNDLITLGEMVPQEEPSEEPIQEPETEEPLDTPVAKEDYQLIYEMNPAGEYEWYLYDNTGEQRTKQKLAEVLTAAHAQSLNMETDAKTVSKQRIVIVVLIAVITILAVVMTIMLFKLRDAYYEAYEDEDEDEEEEEKEKEKSRRREEIQPRKKNVAREEKQPSIRRKVTEPERGMSIKEVTYEEEEKVPVKSAPKRKAKNFLLDDDEFEFEFLNMKDKGDKGL
ncbi:MAG: SH3 domain-containing protein [Blautia sp.]|nr:SH3 domain-containing protein [Lachnoclostridium sp.]MCM1211052.1 SH3 domain-containing protein [Blautia sp.]